MARPRVAMLLVPTLLLAAVSWTAADAADPRSQNDALGRTPPRLSDVSGAVSFWRPGAQDWAPAQVNTPLAPGDELYTDHEARLELQVGGRAFVRAWGDTQVGLANQEPDFLQVKVSTGHLSLDLRGIDPGHTVELDTPHAAFTIERPGYYRIDTTPERTSFTTRRGGRATMTPPTGPAIAISASEEVVLDGAPTPSVQSYVAPELDVWDRWNYARTDDLLDAVSARYVPAGVYGVDDLDTQGTWRVVQSYGPVWVPEAVPVGWVPYSTGKWVWDPHYGWTWVDTAPWGWAPYHYGRWVFVEGFWAWAPGSIVVRPVYAPALVAFFRAPGVRVDVAAPFVSWVALGWGEPVVPWWGRSSFVGRPSWVGWGGPRVVNNVVVNRTTVVNVTNITVYTNTSVQHAVVAVPREQFGRRSVHEARVEQVDVRRLQPVRGAINVKPQAESFVATTGRATRPPDAPLSRGVVATRPPARRASAPPSGDSHPASGPNIPAPRVVTPAPAAPATPAPALRRPPFGESAVERPRPSRSPRLDSTQRPDVAPAPAEPRASDTPPAEPPRRGRDSEARQTPPGSAPPPTSVSPPAPASPRAATPPPAAPSPPAASSPPVRPSAPGTPSRPTAPSPPAASPPRSATAPPHTSPAPQSSPAPSHSGPPATVPRPPTSAPTTSPGPRGPAAPSPERPPAPTSSGPAVGRGDSERSTRQLPGEPANRLFPGRGDGRAQEQGGRRGGPPATPPTASGKEREQR